MNFSEITPTDIFAALSAAVIAAAVIALFVVDGKATEVCTAYEDGFKK
ncbi:MAG: hypothetical protein LBG97_00230 [Coriobacteriales bacterium]|jgi:hypothetical protein|nr:hypothetical protein [Coriobacteriales bacterium]